MPEYIKSGDGYIVEYPEVTFTATRIDFSKSEVHALLRIDERMFGRRVYHARTNLSGASSRRSLAKDLAEIVPDDLDWRARVEDVCCYIIEQVEEGAPVVRIGSIPEREGGLFRCKPLSLEKLPVVLYGRENNGKGLMALTTAMAVHGGWNLAGFEATPCPVMYCDWELDGFSTQRQVQMLAAGFGIDTPDIHYRQCGSPLYQEAEAIGRYIDKEGIGLVIIDSLGYAAGGDKQQQDITLKMFSAMRLWNVSTISIDHMAKGDDADTPFGSVYTLASARNAWRIRGSRQGDEVYVGAYQTKANIAVQENFALKFKFWPDIASPEAIYCEPCDLKRVPGLRQGMTHGEQIVEALRDARQAVTIATLVEMTGIKEKTLRQRVSEMESAMTVVKIVSVGTQSAAKYALRSYADEEAG